jgi:hypothetical protein
LCRKREDSKQEQATGAGSATLLLLLLFASAYFLSIGLPCCCHKLKPPSSAAALLIPFALSVTTAPADVCSFCQEQYVTIILSRGSSFMWFWISPAGMSREPGM